MRTRLIQQLPYRGPLSEAPARTACIIRAVRDCDSAPGIKAQLEDLGFLAGEPVLVTERAFPSGDPLAVHVAESSFALRHAEAACIEVEAIAR